MNQTFQKKLGLIIDQCLKDSGAIHEYRTEEAVKAIVSAVEEIIPPLENPIMFKRIGEEITSTEIERSNQISGRNQIRQEILSRLKE